MAPRNPEKARNKKQKKIRKIWGITTAVGVVLLACLTVFALNAKRISSYYNRLVTQIKTNVGATAPDFELTALTGESVRLSQFRGQPVLLTFGTTWCPYCAKADPLLEDAYSTHTELAVVMVDSGETAKTIREWGEKTGYTFTVLIDSNKAIQKRFAVDTYPTAFFIDEEGVIRAKLIGGVTSVSLSENLSLIGIEH
jgi:peroxiredoxin